MLVKGKKYDLLYQCHSMFYIYLILITHFISFPFILLHQWTLKQFQATRGNNNIAAPNIPPAVWCKSLTSLHPFSYPRAHPCWGRSLSPPDPSAWRNSQHPTAQHPSYLAWCSYETARLQVRWTGRAMVSHDHWREDFRNKQCNYFSMLIQSS